MRGGAEPAGRATRRVRGCQRPLWRLRLDRERARARLWALQRQARPCRSSSCTRLLVASSQHAFGADTCCRPAFGVCMHMRLCCRRSLCAFACLASAQCVHEGNWHKSDWRACREQDAQPAAKFTAQGGLMAAEAIALLKDFYMTGNPSGAALLSNDTLFVWPSAPGRSPSAVAQLLSRTGLLLLQRWSEAVQLSFWRGGSPLPPLGSHRSLAGWAWRVPTRGSCRRSHRPACR